MAAMKPNSPRKTASRPAQKLTPETTSPKVAKVAGTVLKKGNATPAEARILAASALTQAANKTKKR